jgi:acetyl-CoA carboxylase carboxyltransferase component
MDCKTMGNDLALAWPNAEIAVMGAPQAIQVLHGRRLTKDATDNEAAATAERLDLESDYSERYCTPAIAAARGFIDDVIDPLTTRLVLAGALEALVHKRDHSPTRRHSNGPL